MNEALDTPLDIRHYVRMLMRRKGIILLCSATVICSALIGLEFIPEEYESSATLMIEDRQSMARELETVMGGMRPTARGSRADEERLDRLMGRIQSRPFLEKVVRLLRMHEDSAVLVRAEKELEKRSDLTVEELATRIVVGKLKSQISFENTGWGLYRIIVADHHPANAQLLANWISELFADVSVQNSIDELKRSHDFGEEQMRIYAEKLRQSELALESYRQSQIQEDLSANIVNEKNIAAAEGLYQRVLDETDLARMRALPFNRAVTEAGLEPQKASLLSDPELSRQAQGLSSTLEEALGSRLLSEGRGSGEWPPTGSYVEMRRGLLQLVDRKVAELSLNPATGLDDAMVRFVFASFDHKAHADASNHLGQAISTFKTKAQSKPRGEMEVARLESDVTNNRQLLSSFRAQLVASEVSQAMEATDLGLTIEILDPPQIPFAPSHPNRPKILMAVLLMGPLLGVGIAFVSEMMDSTLRSLADFERVFQRPVLGTTPLIDKVSFKSGFFQKYWVTAMLTGVLLLTGFFFLTKDSLFEDLLSVSEPIRVIDPGESGTQ